MRVLYNKLSVCLTWMAVVSVGVVVHARPIATPTTTTITLSTPMPTVPPIANNQDLLKWFDETNPAWFEDFHTYDQIKLWFQALSVKHQDLVRFVPSIGQSVQGRDLFAVHISANISSSTKKPKVWFQSLIHPREWLTGSTTQWLAHELISTRPELLEQVEIIFIPVVNPDGYEITWTTNRMKRTNLNDVDLNRGYDADWGLAGASPVKGPENYRGPAPDSEPEVRAVEAYFLQHPEIVGAVDFHSFSELILRPFGARPATEVPRHEEQLKRVGEEMAKRINAVNQNAYQSIAVRELYPASGTSIDWYYGEKVQSAFGHAVYSYGVELAPRLDEQLPEGGGASGFEAPPSMIVPTGKEIYAALAYLVQQCLQNPLK